MVSESDYIRLIVYWFDLHISLIILIFMFHKVCEYSFTVMICKRVY